MARRVKHYCEEHHIAYRNRSSFMGLERPATKHDLRTPNNMLYHAPVYHIPALSEKDKHVYLLWYDESYEEIQESLAFLRLRGDHRLYLVNMKGRKG